ncbi:MmgE/PrpD family protein [Alicyclobacillus cycloheptanicus]|uniref:2-methylcitrate dehydratase PrpD n=1 Tax=Alicyclobacillus cycloheptanicus TaxID=1457 RepID=A0ABT9XP39_9BACL|nr:MmgE/PrpD family protein [Alicyclobacillus cycloheptanicus]MDQ0191523.1 2-methylcitrate dehydratase PrpD [Alicyclobacillus cycloheptanicus]WDM02223.1 MmgE/PrpD family protein [Alicyclobacillus cycloheptanicus]
MTALRQLAEYIVGATFTRTDLEEASLHAADTFIANACGCQTTEGQKISSLLNGADHGVLPNRLLTESDLLQRLSLRSAITRLTEIDDIHRASCVTPGVVVVSTAVELWKASGGCSAASFLEAIIVGYEAMTRLGRVIQGADVVYRGIWPTYFCAAVGSATVTARLLGLSEEATAHALSMALTLSTGGVNRGNSFPFRWMTLGRATADGCYAAIVAANGFTGTSDLSDTWFHQTYGLQSNIALLTSGLGDTPQIYQCSLKPYCAAKQAIPSIEGMKRALESGVRIDDVEEIRVFVPPQFVTMIDHPPANRLFSISSVPYGLAISAHLPEQLYNVSRDGIVMNPQVLDLMNRVSVYPDAGLLADYPEVWATRVEVRTRHETRVEDVVETLGDPEMRLDMQGLEQKWRTILDTGDSDGVRLVRLCLEVVCDVERVIEAAMEVAGYVG